MCKTLKNRKEKAKIYLFIGLPPNKRYRFSPLARHDNFNDAHIRSSN